MPLFRIAIPDVPLRAGNDFDEAVKLRLQTPVVAELPVYTVQQLNELNPNRYTNVLVACSNGDAGDECLAYCNGRAWFVVDLGSRIAIS